MHNLLLTVPTVPFVLPKYSTGSQTGKQIILVIILCNFVHACGNKEMIQ